VETLIGLLTVENGVALVTLTALEIVLGIDNIVFLAILSSRLPPEQQPRARRLGLLAAMGMRIALLCAVGWIAHLTDPWTEFSVAGVHVALSGRNLILIVGGLVLMAKSVREIHHKTFGHEAGPGGPGRTATFGAVIVQIMLIDVVFSIDSVITAVGMAQSIAIMITAVVLSVGVMMIFAEPVSRFVDRQPSIKMLALAFLFLIGFILVAEGFDHAVPKGYIYFGMAFALGVEMLNIRSESRRVARRGRPAE
jgi:predicted tellurium resistance membrane protein TerC